ncbi:MAG: hypothetical protein H8E70_04925 [Candidatus Marinimicrobia bacterium]|nr:hypothetical protein [Candidatus Neomarinimicrobiota bacterium]
MIKHIKMWIILLFITGTGYGQFEIGLDVFNRYVWRGTDFGNAASLQPYLEYSKGPIKIGAWSSWAVNNGNANENDVFITANLGGLTLSITDYFFPVYDGSDRFFDYSEEGGEHFVEAGISTTIKAVDIFAGYFFIDTNNSTYLELSYGPVILGMGNGMFTIEPEDENDSFGIVNIGITAQRDLFSAAYIINPQQETSFLVFGVSL